MKCVTSDRIHNDRLVLWLEFPVGLPLPKVQRRVLRSGRAACLIFACTDRAGKMALAFGFGQAVANRESANRSEPESKVTARIQTCLGSKMSSFARSVLLLFHDGKNLVSGIFRKMVLLSSSGGQPGGVPEVCVILGASGILLTNNVGRCLMPSTEISV